MPLLTGALSLRRFTLDLDVGSTFQSTHDALVPRLLTHAFREPLNPSAEPVIGWVNPTNPLVTAFSDPNTWRFEPYLLLSIRVDQRKVSGTLRSAHLKQRIAAWCRDRDVERCPASVRAELREAITDELLRKTMPSMQVYELLVNTEQNYVVVANLSDTVTDLVRKLVFRTFGVRLVPLDPLTLMPDAQSEVLSGELVGVLTSHFLHWFWWRSEQNACVFALEPQGNVDAWVDSRVLLESKSGTSDKALLTGENPSGTREARAALVGGKIPSEIRMGIRRDNLEYLVTIRGMYLDLASIKLPISSGEDLEETVRIRALAYEDLFALITSLVRMFAEERTDDTWNTEIAPAMKTWAHVESDDDRDADRFRKRTESFDRDVSDSSPSA